MNQDLSKNLQHEYLYHYIYNIYVRVIHSCKNGDDDIIAQDYHADLPHPGDKNINAKNEAVKE